MEPTYDVTDAFPREDFRVFKYEIPVTDEPWISMPRGARLLHVAAQGNRLYAWALVNCAKPLTSENIRVTFRVAGTGHRIEPRIAATWAFLGTVLMREGALVWHVWAEPSEGVDLTMVKGAPDAD